MRGYFPDIYVNDWIVGLLVGLLSAVLIGAVMIRLALYVLRSFSLYKIARRREIRGAWLAWVPVAGDWILGSVADQYQYVSKGRIKNRRLPLLLLGLCVAALQTVTMLIGITWLEISIRTMTGQIPAGAVSPLIGAYVLPALAWIGTVVQLVIRCFAVYDLYRSCTTRYNILFLVLGLVFQFLEPVFFFICRDKEEGMPPRRETIVCCEPEPQTGEG